MLIKLNKLTNNLSIFSELDNKNILSLALTNEPGMLVLGSYLIKKEIKRITLPIVGVRNGKTMITDEIDWKIINLLEYSRKVDELTYEIMEGDVYSLLLYFSAMRGTNFKEFSLDLDGFENSFVNQKKIISPYIEEN